MYDPPGYLWAITIAGVIAVLAATCVVLYAERYAPAWAGCARRCSQAARPSSSAAPAHHICICAQKGSTNTADPHLARDLVLGNAAWTKD
jgi:hypothetical protein